MRAITILLTAVLVSGTIAALPWAARTRAADDLQLALEAEAAAEAERMQRLSAPERATPEPAAPLPPAAAPRPMPVAPSTRPLAGIGPVAFGSGGSAAATSGALAHLMTAGDMIGFSRDLSDGTQAITIINASQRWMAVYHIDTSGQIRLTSSRPLEADFTIQFNASSPLPEEIRRLQGK